MLTYCRQWECTCCGVSETSKIVIENAYFDILCMLWNVYLICLLLAFFSLQLLSVFFCGWHIGYTRPVCIVSLWNMQSIIYPSSLCCSQPTLQVGCDSFNSRQWPNSDYTSCKEMGVNVKYEDDVVQRWVDRRRSSFRMSLDVLIGQLDRRLSLEATKNSKVGERRTNQSGVSRRGWKWCRSIGV